MDGKGRDVKVDDGKNDDDNDNVVEDDDDGKQFSSGYKIEMRFCAYRGSSFHVERVLSFSLFLFAHTHMPTL